MTEVVAQTLRRILRTPAAAEYIGLAQSTLEKLRVVGRGPLFIRLGGRAIGYDVRDLDAWLDGQRVHRAPSATSRNSTATKPR
jgi:predicted DNA-binding transcriptional regulator AlpA